jgi:hypothetical protein
MATEVKIHPFEQIAGAGMDRTIPPCQIALTLSYLNHDGLAHCCEYLLIRWEPQPPLFRHYLIAYPNAELAAVAFD